ncbi:DUF1566 domain-containing protein [Desulfobotulus sp.]|jgi:hypothetical protein|uniref:Lcl C-terminal domain-containing protein n=1 Tax=Desulfobotulus sp. TaxID=1940337 RepID=UPI002A36470A|nr:DUF1566 domain-containing protein [Desulfobotulus sp.]MDY0164272.1 DUF1566 domain-containing protein [Desulfobotulus sp.]
MKKNTVHAKGYLRKNLAIVLGLLVFFCFAGFVQAAQPPQLPARFQVVANSNGAIVRDNNSGLEWQRCAYGQSWTGSGCSGSAWQGSWHDAVRITAPDGFRVPTIDELKTLAPYDQNVFPGAYRLWSCSPDAYSNSAAWGLHFGGGYPSNGLKGYGSQVRLVRDGQ